MPHPAISQSHPRQATPRWSATIPATPDQVSRARHQLAAFLNGSPVAEDALLCLSELVTNAILHSHSARPGGVLTVTAILTPGRLRVEVQDDGGPWQPPTTSDGLRGRGLAIVAALARWGITGDGTGRRTVWFELPITPHG
jgi:anti-sigma regulatory factor (Ser/Thr protein kinase)